MFRPHGVDGRVLAFSGLACPRPHTRGDTARRFAPHARPGCIGRMLEFCFPILEHSCPLFVQIAQMGLILL